MASTIVLAFCIKNAPPKALNLLKGGGAEARQKTSSRYSSSSSIMIEPVPVLISIS
jgi:hypothetical protein